MWAEKTLLFDLEPEKTMYESASSPGPADEVAIRSLPTSDGGLEQRKW
jgi:hypothetical protein